MLLIIACWPRVFGQHGDENENENDDDDDDG